MKSKKIKNNKKKGLQKFTHLETINTLSEVKNFLNEKPEENDVYDFLDILEVRINETYNNKLGRENILMQMLTLCYNYLKDDDSVDEIRNTMYEVNNQKITISIQQFASKHYCFPLITQIAQDTGLSRPTIYKHLTNGLKNDFNNLVMGKINYMTSDVLTKLYTIGITQSNVKALKTYLDYVNLVEKGSTTRVNNYVQINNLKITNDDLNSLPEQTIIEIEKLIKNNIFGNQNLNLNSIEK